MSDNAIELPTSLRERIAVVAAEQGISVDALVAATLEEMLRQHDAFHRLRVPARQGSKEDFERALAAIPDAPPASGDELPASWSKSRDKAAS